MHAYIQSGEKLGDETSNLKRWFLKNSFRIFVAATIRHQLHPRPVTCFPKVTREAVPKVRVHDSTTIQPKMFLSLSNRERYAFSLSLSLSVKREADTRENDTRLDAWMSEESKFDVA